uniref:SCP domain-containing protein n=1 Tax=Solanum lycopersicum TaxID=4081 RepID=A0A3Q7JAR6_SOLLC
MGFLLFSQMPSYFLLDYLDAHNTARAIVGVGPLTWDDNVGAYAQQHASQLATDCNLVHSHGQYCEDLAAGSGDIMKATNIVEIWVDEKQYYYHESNTCSNRGYVVSCNYDPPGNFICQNTY